MIDRQYLSIVYKSHRRDLRIVIKMILRLESYSMYMDMKADIPRSKPVVHFNRKGTISNRRFSH